MTSAAAISPKSLTSIVTPWSFPFNEAAITSEKTEGVKPSEPFPVLIYASTRRGSSLSTISFGMFNHSKPTKPRPCEPKSAEWTSSPLLSKNETEVSLEADGRSIIP